MSNDTVLRVVSFIMIPFIMIFSLYIQFHGEVSPGGGFQAGAISACGVILYSWIFGSKIFLCIFKLRNLEIASSLGILLYAFVGIISVFMGGNFLDYSVFFANNPVLGQQFGVFFVELGVYVTVSSTFIMIYFNLDKNLKNAS